MMRPGRPFRRDAVRSSSVPDDPLRAGRPARPAPCCGARDLDTACLYHLDSDTADTVMRDGTPAAVAHAAWALENSATLRQAAAATGLSERFAGLIARPLWSGPVRAR